MQTIPDCEMCGKQVDLGAEGQINMVPLVRDRQIIEFGACCAKCTAWIGERFK